MIMVFEYSDAAFPATNDSIFIAVADLPGLTSTELASSVNNTLRQGRSVFALLKKIYSIVSATGFNALGVSVASSEGKPGTGLTSRIFAYTAQYLSDIAAQTVGQIPVPSTGVNSGLGKFALTDIFPTAVKVAAGANTSGAGIVIATSALIPYGSPAHSSLNIASGQDNRAYLAALFNWLTDGGLTVRATGTPSGITAAVRSTPASAALPANATAASNPTTGISSSQVNSILLNSVTYTITVETIDNQSTDTFDVNGPTTPNQQS